MTATDHLTQQLNTFRAAARELRALATVANEETCPGIVVADDVLAVLDGRGL